MNRKFTILVVAFVCSIAAYGITRWALDAYDEWYVTSFEPAAGGMMERLDQRRR